MQNLADEVLPSGAPLPRFDIHAALMSCPKILGTTVTTVPRAGIVSDCPGRSRGILGRAIAEQWHPQDRACLGRQAHASERPAAIDPAGIPVAARRSEKYNVRHRSTKRAREPPTAGITDSRSRPRAMRFRRHCRVDFATGSADHGRHLGRPSRRRIGKDSLAAASILPRLALASRSRRHAVVSKDAAFPPATRRRLVAVDQTDRHRIKSP